MRKNQYEEALFRCEDERYEVDMVRARSLPWRVCIPYHHHVLLCRSLKTMHQPSAPLSPWPRKLSCYKNAKYGRSVVGCFVSCGGHLRCHGLHCRASIGSSAWINAASACCISRQLPVFTAIMETKCWNCCERTQPVPSKSSSSA